MTQRAPSHDRNPLIGGATFDGPAVAPHALTQRATYTVPAGRSAFVYSMLSMLRTAVAAPVGMHRVFSLAENIAGVPGIIAQQISSANAALGTAAQSFPPVRPLLRAGQSISAYTEDLSTGGAVSFVASLLWEEFDE